MGICKMMITKRNFYMLSLMFMILLNFHICSRSKLTKINTLKNNKITVNSRYESENKNKVKETKKTTTKSTVKTEEHKENKMKKTKAQEQAEEEKTEEKVA